MKKCTNCLEEKDTCFFFADNRNKDKLNNRCKICVNQYSAKYYANGTNRERSNKRIRDNNKNNPAKTLFIGAKNRAKKYGIEFSINRYDIFVPTYCPILDLQLCPSNNIATDGSPSLDRIDNNRGYVSDNVVVISWRANRIKSKASLAEMRKIIETFDDGTTRILHDTLNNKQYIKELLRSAKKRANHKNIEFNLTTEDILIPYFCPILDIEIFKGTGIFTDNSPSIDRIDNSIGYVPNNIRIISRKANTLKNNASKDEYIKIYDFYSSIASKREEAVYLLQQSLNGKSNKDK
jgi:archaellum component FlaC